jgi:hypothetical protein
MIFAGDGLAWERAGCVIEGCGYSSDELDAVHSEDMPLVEIGDANYRMYYAACDRNGNWRIARARSERTETTRVRSPEHGIDRECSYYTAHSQL